LGQDGLLAQALNRAAMSALASSEDGVLKRRRKASPLRDLALAVTLLLAVIRKRSFSVIGRQGLCGLA